MIVATEQQLVCPQAHKFPVWGKVTGHYFCGRCKRMYLAQDFPDHDRSHEDPHNR